MRSFATASTTAPAEVRPVPRASRCRTGVASALLCLIGLAGPGVMPAPASGPELIRPTLVSPAPSPGLERFLSGDLGILHADLAPEYWLAAAAQIIGQAAPGDALRRGSQMRRRRYGWREGRDAWQAARRTAGIHPVPDLAGDGRRLVEEVDGRTTYRWIPGCTEDAFATAARTLEERRTQYADAATFRNWVIAQDQVFAVCTGGTDTVPDPLPGSVPALARFDREYQIAAAYFYLPDYDKAEGRFRAIALQPASPWHGIAAYLVARVHIRRALYDAGGDEELRRAVAAFAAILADPRLEEQHRRSRDLQRFAMAQLDAQAMELEIVAALVGPPPEGAEEPSPDERVDWLYELLYLIRRSNTAAICSAAETPASPAASVLLAIHCITGAASRAAGAEAATFTRVHDEWRSSGDRLWLAASLVLAEAAVGDQVATELVDAAAAIGPDDMLYSTALYHRSRLLIGLGRHGGARTALDSLLGTPDPPDGGGAGLAPLDRNLLLALRAPLAQSLPEYFRLSRRRAVRRVPERDGSWRWHPGDVYLDDRARALLNRFFPPAELLALLDDDALPASLLPEVATRAWALALRSGRQEIAVRAARIAARLTPDLREDLDAYLNAPPGPERHFAGALVLLRNRTLKTVVPSNDVWDYEGYTLWCRQGPWWAETQWPEDLVDGAEALLPAAQRQEAQAMHEAIAEASWLGFVSDAVFEFASVRPSDPRVPEALHRFVALTRYSACREGDLSGRAFRLLHAKYPDTAWAARTPYWY